MLKSSVAYNAVADNTGLSSSV